MTPFAIYVAEPQAINLDIVTASLGDTPHTLIAGSPDFATNDASGCDTVLIRSGTHIDSTIAAKMPLLKRVVRVGVGLDNVDLAFCKQHNIAAYNAPGANADAVAEYAVAVLLMAIRNIHLLTLADQQSWNRFKFMGHGITSRTVGIVGFGHIGKLLYAKLHSLGCRNFIIYDPFVTNAPQDARMASLDELLQHSNVISLHLPLTPETKHIINGEKLALLPEGAVLLNAARGGIVDESALLVCTDSKHLIYIADTVEDEPHPNQALLGRQNVIITPHIASLTDDAEAAMIRVAIENLLTDKQAAI
jgi:phosphoglycerate dehydrogenase-like enzyme